MDDVFLDDRRQISAKAANRENQLKTGRRKRKFRYYLADLFIKAIIAAVLIAINFTLFSGAGSYSLFNAAQQLNPEALYIYTAIFFISFALTFLLSFSRLLENLFVSAILMLFMLALFNQFAIFDKTSFLAGNMGQFFSSVPGIFTNHSDLIISGLIGLFLFLFLTFTRHSTQAYLMGTLIIIFGGLLSESYFNPVSRDFETVYDKSAETAKQTADGKNFIYLAFPDLTSYANLRDFLLPENGNKSRSNYNAKIQTAMDVMLGFYTQHNFALYPHAYVAQSDPFTNLLLSLNLADPAADPSHFTQTDVLLKSYWDFRQLSAPTIYLKDNKLFESFSRSKYNLTVYQSRGIETCQVNNKMAVNVCIKKHNVPTNLENLGFNTAQKTAMLFNQWAESTGLISNLNPLYPLLGIIDSKITPPSYPAKDLYVINSDKILDLITRDISNNGGNNAYLAIIDLPSDMYIYDAFCRLKPEAEWMSAKPNNWYKNNNDLKRKEAYAEQLTCLFGRLENFMQQLSKQSRLSSTMIFIQGLSNPRSTTASSNIDFYNQLKAGKQVALAVYDPLKYAPRIDNVIAPVPAIIKTILYKKPPHQSFSEMNLAENTRQELLRKFGEDQITAKEVQLALPNFINWYQKWAETNKVENSLASLVIETVDEKTIENVDSAADNPQETEPSTKESTSESKDEAPSQETPAVDPTDAKPKTEGASAEENPSQPEIKITAKVIDTQTEDVIPPFLEDQTEEIAPTE